MNKFIALVALCLFSLSGIASTQCDQLAMKKAEDACFKEYDSCGEPFIRNVRVDYLKTKATYEINVHFLDNIGWMSKKTYTVSVLMKQLPNGSVQCK